MEQFNYLANPSISNRFLMFIVTSQFVQGKVDCSVLQIDVYEICFDIVTNNDNEEVTFLNFPLTGKKKTTKCNENIKPQICATFSRSELRMSNKIADFPSGSSVFRNITKLGTFKAT